MDEQSTRTKDQPMIGSDGEVDNGIMEVQTLEGDERSLTFRLSEDLNRKDQLASFRSHKSPPLPTKLHRPDEQQLLREGKLGESEFSAQLQTVSFGTYRGKPACLILLLVNFSPKNRGFFRFRDATVEVEFEEEDIGEDDDDEDTLYAEQAGYSGPRVRQFYPKLIRGHVQNRVETCAASVTLPVPAVNVETGWSSSGPREGLHLIHGWTTGEPATVIKWKLKENEVSRGGIYERPQFAVIVQHPEQQRFFLSLKLKATTWGGIPIVGKGGSRIALKPPCTNEAAKDSGIRPDAEKGILRDLFGRSVEVDKQMWVEEGAKASQLLDLREQEYLEELTLMRLHLLGAQGPGVGKSDAGVGA